MSVKENDFHGATQIVYYGSLGEKICNTFLCKLYLIQSLYIALLELISPLKCPWIISKVLHPKFILYEIKTDYTLSFIGLQRIIKFINETLDKELHYPFVLT